MTKMSTRVRKGGRRKTSRFIGVHRTNYVGRPWTAQIRIANSKRVSLGAWRTERQAAEAYDRAVLFYRGAAAPRNFSFRRFTPSDAKTLQIEAWRHFKDQTTSRYRGVVKDPPSWRAQIRPKLRQISLGHWPTEQEAAEAYDRAARFFSFDRRQLNFPGRNLVARTPDAIGRDARLSRKVTRATSKYRGVFLSARESRRPWMAQIAVEGRRPRHLGTWATETDAARAYDRAASFYLGAREGVNLPRERSVPADAATLVSIARKEGKLARTSRYIGVSWSEPQSRWRAQIQHHGRHMTIDYFSRERDAAEAYDARAIAFRGAHARLNFDPSTGKPVWGKRPIDLRQVCRAAWRP
jgi:hypothetical protein